MCSLAARGLWIELLSIAHEATPCGHVLINGRAPSPAAIASVVGSTEREVKRALDELEAAGVFDRSADGAIVSRRMARDHAAREAGIMHGKTGGNPTLKGETAGGLTPPDNPSVKPRDNHGVNIKRKEERGTEEEGSLRSPTREPAGFAEWWAAYPKKHGKADARAAYVRAVKRGASPAGLLTALRVFPFEQNDFPRFVKDPARWLNSGEWECASEAPTLPPAPVVGARAGRGDWAGTAPMFGFDAPSDAARSAPFTIDGEAA